MQNLKTGTAKIKPALKVKLLKVYHIRINFDAEKIWRNWRKMAQNVKLNPRQI